MTLLRKGLILAAIQCVLVLSTAGKLLYDRSTCPRVWVRTAPWDPSLPLRGRYLALRLTPDAGAPWYAETAGAVVIFFVPEHPLAFEASRDTRTDLWAEVTIPRKGPPRPIRLAIRKDGQLQPIQVD